jgi:predicted flap endonuclease-1-like 5' DNA nuclease
MESAQDGHAILKEETDMFRKLSAFIVLMLATLAMGGFSRPSLAAVEQEGNPWWLWIIVFFVLAGFVVFMLWWWIRGAGEEEGVTPRRSAEVTPAVPPVQQEVASRPPQPIEPAQEDDLKKIEGIGPKIAGVLKGAGIRTFGQLAATDVESIRGVLERSDPNLLRLADPSTWPQQAGLAAEGRWEELEKLQADLKGGRRSEG